MKVEVFASTLAEGSECSRVIVIDDHEFDGLTPAQRYELIFKRAMDTSRDMMGWRYRVLAEAVK